MLPILAAVAAGIGWLMMEKPHRDVGGEVARHKMVPEELQMVLAEGEAAAPYLDAVVELYGVVLEDDGRRVMLEGGVVASWDTTRDRRLLEKGELIKLKGRVTGYDDLFEEVRMDGLVLVRVTAMKHPPVSPDPAPDWAACCRSPRSRRWRRTL